MKTFQSYRIDLKFKNWSYNQNRWKYKSCYIYCLLRRHNKMLSNVLFKSDKKRFLTVMWLRARLKFINVKRLFNSKEINSQSLTHINVKSYCDVTISRKFDNFLIIFYFDYNSNFWNSWKFYLFEIILILLLRHNKISKQMI